MKKHNAFRSWKLEAPSGWGRHDQLNINATFFMIVIPDLHYVVPSAEKTAYLWRYCFKTFPRVQLLSFFIAGNSKNYLSVGAQKSTSRYTYPVNAHCWPANVQSHQQLFLAAMSRRSQNPWTPEAKTGVNYFKHTTKHFLTPYGKTHGILTSREILDKLFHWNCEWLTRPNYAISELVDTLYSNLATLAEYRDKVFTCHAVNTLLNKARPIRTVLQRFNKKDSATAEEPDERDLASLMKFIEDDTLKSLSKHLFAASDAMYSIATHLMTLETLFSHPA